jgi:hypothetical protein
MDRVINSKHLITVGRARSPAIPCRICYGQSTIKTHLSPTTSISLTGAIRGFGGLEDACWPLLPTFAGSNPAEAVEFFRTKKSSASFPLEGK